MELRLFLISLVISLGFPALAEEETCNQYLSPIVRYESLFGKVLEVRDVSHMAEESKAFSDPSIRVVDVSEHADELPPFLGFGRPNVYLVVPQKNELSETELYQVAAKSLKRGDTKYDVINGRIQSGLMMTFDDLSEAEATRLHEAAASYAGDRKWTCVNTNCRILEDAGFSIGGEAPSQFYFPNALLKAITQNGMELNGRDVKFTLYRSSPQYLEDYNKSIGQAVRTTLCRHADRACQLTEGQRDGLRPYIAKIGQKLVAFIRPKDQYEKTLIMQGQNIQAEPTQSEALVGFSVSEPSNIGLMLRGMWGAHAFHEVDLAPVQDKLKPMIEDGYLKAFPAGAPTFQDKLKQSILFRPTVISAIRSHMAASWARFDGVGVSTLFNLLRVHDEESGDDNKYNIVITKNKIIVTKVKMRHKISDWVLAKHVLSSNYSDEVLFAGEVWKDSNGDINFNNDSGSYRPDEERLRKTVDFFSEIFPGFNFYGQSAATGERI